jgi:chromosome partitioning protein
MRTIAIINQKGGCGKTTTSINLAACLARLGQKTLLVDMDPQGHCGVGLAVPEDQIERTIFDTLIEDIDGRPAKISEVVWQIASDFDLAPSNIKLAAFEQVFSGRTGREDRLASALATAGDHYQWAIVDCPPSVGLITFNALKACDEVVVPVETGYFSLHGLTKMMETLEVMKDRCGRDILIRVLPTLYDTRTKLAREVLSELRAKFRGYLMESTVNFNTKLKEAASFGQPITEYDPGSRGYKDFVNLARELMGHRPVDLEPTPTETLSRPAELVQRAKQLAQLANFQFGRPNSHQMPTSTPSVPPREPAAPDSRPFARPEPMRNAATLSRASEMGLNLPEQPGFLNGAKPGGNGQAVLGHASHHDGVGSPGDDSIDGGSVALAPAPVLALAPAPAVATAVVMKPKIEITAEPQTQVSVEVRTAPLARKPEPTFGVKQLGDQVLFAARFENARKVLIAGDFNNWSPMASPMVNGDAPGLWVTKLPLYPGRYRYRFIVDGRWTTDPNNTYVESNQFGELNNVVEVV